MRKAKSFLPFGAQQYVEMARRGIAALRDEDWYRLEWPPRRDFYSKAFKMLSFNRISGDYAEFGCGQRSLTLAFRESRRVGLNCKLWGFDSFEGLPEREGLFDEHPKWVPGTMKEPIERLHQHARWYGLKPGTDYELVQGFYKETLRRKALPQDLCLAYLDCDLHSSATDVLEFLQPRLKNGMIIAFDDYFCYSVEQMSGERRASLEMFTEDPGWNLVPYVQFGWFGMSFVVEAKQSGH